MDDRTVSEDSRVEEFYNHKFTIADVDLDTLVDEDGEEYENQHEYMPEAVYKSKEDIEELGWIQQKTTLSAAESIQFEDMIGIPMDDPRWDEFLNQFTYAELVQYIAGGRDHNPAISRINKPGTGDSDGPSQFQIIWWVGGPIVAATYNVDLARKQGECVGMEGHVTNTYGWAGPAVNIHRSPFGGRNFEYYSADPLVSGRIAGRVVAGTTDRGVYCYFKHFAVNDQEKGREGISTFVSEQALREIYLKSFQMVFQEAKATGVMSSYNRLGLMETAASYPLLTEVLRGEWGFKGAVLSDMTHHSNNSFDNKCYENINNRCLAGCNAQLDNSQFSDRIEAKWSDSAFDGKGAPTFTYDGETYESYSWWYAVRNCAREHLWMYANCGGMDREFVLSNEGIVTEKDSFKLRVDEEFETTIELDNLEGELSIDPCTPLPEGLEFDGETISGTPVKDGDVRINILVTNNDSVVAGKIIELIVMPANGEPSEEPLPPVGPVDPTSSTNSENPEPSSSEQPSSPAPVSSSSEESKPSSSAEQSESSAAPASSSEQKASKKAGCGGSITAVSAVAAASLLALALVGVLSIRALRKKEVK